MPRKPIDYSNTIIYKLCCNDTLIKEIYVGHTTNWTKRKGSHKTRCNNENSEKYNLYVYQFIREHGGFENWSMVEIEKLCCTDTHDALKNERKYIDLLGATLNKVLPTRTYKEYYEHTREEILENKKEYYYKNKDKINYNHKEYYETNKDKLLEKQKEYSKKNKEHITEYSKDYYENHKDEIIEKHKEYRDKNIEDLNEKKKKYYEKNKKIILEKQKLKYHEKKNAMSIV